MEKWEDLNCDSAAIREYEARHKAMMDRLVAEAECERRQKVKYEEGIEKGEFQKAVEIAKEMLEDGMPIETIPKKSKLSIGLIKQLQKGGFITTSNMGDHV